MGQIRILHGPSGNRFKGMAGPEDSQGAYAHQGSVGLAFMIFVSSEGCGYGSAVVERVGVKPVFVGFEGSLRIVGFSFNQRPGQHQGHLRVIGGLPGDGVEGAAVGQFPQASRILSPDTLRRLELHQAAEGVSGKLADHASPGPFYHHRSSSLKETVIVPASSVRNRLQEGVPGIGIELDADLRGHVVR
ncbi:hypothetical protein SDC9_50282 [bioreactor metagenome]|uniref:Uncharacterized protein n=1 Tax=bioreactor metagenome TaxID=1076179 RepID=A0A644WJE5_9ZZZZ